MRVQFPLFSIFFLKQKKLIKLFGFSWANILTSYVKQIILRTNELEFWIYADKLYPFCTIFKTHISSQQNCLIDIVAQHFLNPKIKYSISYLFLNPKTGLRFRVLIAVNNEYQSFSVFSLVSLFKSANWLEREVWDMFGIVFFNHPDLRRILTDYGFKWAPLRKDFPLTGYKEVFWDEINQKLKSTPVILKQNYRIFTISETWKK